MDKAQRSVALITGGSRGIGAATAIALAKCGYDVAITYHNKAARANEVLNEITTNNVRGWAFQCDITRQEDRERLFAEIKAWTEHIDLLVLNASGGLEKNLLAVDSDYPMHINRDAQIATLNGALLSMPAGSTLVFVTSHWAHLYGKVQDLPAYATIAKSKYAGEQALRQQQNELGKHGIRLIVVTGDLIEGTITPRLLERTAPGMKKDRQQTVGQLPTATEMGEAIAMAATDETLPSGSTVVVGGTLESLPPLISEQSPQAL